MAEAADLAIPPEAQDFLDQCPTTTGAVKQRVTDFLKRQCSASGAFLRPVVCITSGGTTVPLEKRCIRFIDNFSGGTRGALSTESFLEAGYAVIFLNRKHSIQPFTKGLPSGEIMECLTEMLDNPNQTGKDGRAIIKQAAVLAAGVHRQGVLLRITFETLFEYLKYLEVIAVALRVCGPKAAFFLAAAVSDFYIPWSTMVEHKMQSSDAGKGLTLELQKVPKMLSVLRHCWAPEAFVVSFKLETDESILLEKAQSSIDRYGVHLVVANILDRRKEQVQLVFAPQDSSSIEPGVVTIQRDDGESVIELPLVVAVVSRHTKFWMYGSLHGLG